jgi:phosphoglycolate phosphatase
MVGVAFGVAPGDDRFEYLRDAFLARYEQAMLERTRLFDGIEALLASMEAASIAWGIVTNKATRFAVPVAEGLGLVPRTGALVCGDTTPHSKPHPEPLWEAARRLGHPPADCLYVGDDLRDVQAGRAAGMATLVAGWGYLGEGDHVDTWGADAIVESPSALLNWLQLA